MTDCVFCVGEQTVAHSYLHVVPRHTGDDIKPE
jgi:diadenosine tetraphosphate (Ap4A) HIT family hydrolase